VIERDPRGRFQFAPLQSKVAASLLAQHPGHAVLPDSVVLVDQSGLYVKSAAALRVARGLRFPWPVFWIFMLVPRPVRDWIYDFVARHRYRWFGKRDVCMVPTSEIRARFLEMS
jgi:predicted DCC family thiol-disulfide oxidoreductase YuxK